MHHSLRITLKTLLAAVLVVAGAAAGGFACSGTSRDDRAASATAPEATHEPTPSETRTDAHSAPHIDLPAGVLVFSDWSGAVYTVRPDGTGLSKVGMAARFTRPMLVRGGSRVNFQPGSPSAFAPPTSLSPDGWRLATFDKDGVHVANADGSGSRLVSADITQSPPMSRIAWAGDNRHLFVWGGNGPEGTLFSAAGALFDVDSGTSQMLPYGGLPLAISPSGDRIAYLGPSNGLRVARPDGSDLVDVSTGMEVALYDVPRVAWSPDGQRLAFPVAGAGNGFAIAAADGSRTIRIPAVSAASSALTPSLVWSPDGRYIAASGDQFPIEHHRVLVFDTRNVGSPPVAFDAGLTPYESVSVVWWDNGRGFYFIGRGEYVGEGVAHQAVYSVSLDGKTDILLSGAVDVASIVGVTH